jgi:hypothetical protein
MRHLLYHLSRLRRIGEISDDQRDLCEAWSASAIRKDGEMMAIASFWTQEFLEEVTAALEVSLGRVTDADLRSDPEEAHWEQAQEWLRVTKKFVGKSPTGEGDVTTPPPFPLTGEQLRSLQRAVDRAAQARTTQKTPSKAQRIVNEARNQAPVSVYERLRQGLDRVRVSSRILASLLVVICALNLAEWIFFSDAVFRPVFGIGFVLSAIALVLWFRHYLRIRNHTHYVEGISAHL